MPWGAVSSPEMRAQATRAVQQAGLSLHAMPSSAQAQPSLTVTSTTTKASWPPAQKIQPATGVHHTVS